MSITNSTEVKCSECYVIKFRNTETNSNPTVSLGICHSVVFKGGKQNKHIGIPSNTTM